MKAGDDPTRIDPRSREIREHLREFGVDLDGSVDDDQSLIDSGLLDSLALFHLVLWVENKTGRAIDPNTVDLAREWDSISLVLAYVDRSAERFAPSAPAGRGADAPKRAIRRASGLEVIRYAPEHKRAIAEFQTGLWSVDSERNRRYFEWKYEEQPLGIEPHIYLAIERQKIVGMRGFYGSRWCAGMPAQEHDVLIADDLLVHQNHRDQGVVHHLMQAALDDLGARGETFVFNSSGSPATVLGSLAMGWRSAGSLEPIQRRSAGQTLRHRVRKATESLPFLWRYANSQSLYGSAERDPFRIFDSMSTPTVSSRGIPVHISREPQIELMMQLVRRLPRDQRIRHVRDASYLAWRFRNPFREYRFLYIGRESIDGYLILGRRRNNNDAFVSIVDLEFADDSTRKSLLEVATRVGLIPQLDAWSATLDAPTNGYLSRAGFKSATRAKALKGHPCVLVRATDDRRLAAQWTLNGVPLLEWRNWDMRMIDTMVG